MSSLSDRDKSFVVEVASGRIRPFGWSGWFLCLGPPVLLSAVWLGLIGWTVHSEPTGTRAVLCLFDGATCRASTQLSQLQNFGIMLFLLLLGWLFYAVRMLRNLHNRLLRISKALNDHETA